MTKLAIARMNLLVCQARLTTHNLASCVAETTTVRTGVLVVTRYSALDHRLVGLELEERVAEAEDALADAESEERRADMATLACRTAEVLPSTYKVNAVGAGAAMAFFAARGVMS